MNTFTKLKQIQEQRQNGKSNNTRVLTPNETKGLTLNTPKANHTSKASLLFTLGLSIILLVTLIINLLIYANFKNYTAEKDNVRTELRETGHQLSIFVTDLTKMRDSLDTMTLKIQSLSVFRASSAFDRKLFKRGEKGVRMETQIKEGRLYERLNLPVNVTYEVFNRPRDTRKSTSSCRGTR